MFERLRKARADVKRNEKKLKEAQEKYDASLERLKEVEKTEILEIVESQKMTPEQLAEYFGVTDGMKVPTVADKKKTGTNETTDKKGDQSAFDIGKENDEDMEDITNEDF